MAEQPKFSVLRHNQEWLILKETNGKSFVVATCYLEIVAERICDLLREWQQKKETQDEKQNAESAI